MCGRFTLKTSAEKLASLFDVLNFPTVFPRYNIAPTQKVLALRQTDDRTVEAVNLRWGLVPSWAKDLKIGARMINARSETVATKPSFRAAFKRQRCLIMTDGFFEWQKLAEGKQPFYIRRSDNLPFCFAGLWESWTDPAARSRGDSGESDLAAIETCTILTTTPNEMLAKIHDRMPVILDSVAQSIWLDRDCKDPTQLEKLLAPYPTAGFTLDPVSTLVNKPANDSPACIVPLTETV